MEMVPELQKNIERKLPGLKLQLEKDAIIVAREDLHAVARFLKEDESYKMDYLSCVTGVDYKEYLETVYHLYSMGKKRGPIVLKVRVNKEDPRIPSLTPLYRGAEFQEREAYDMFGIVFENHPDLRRILMWEGFAYYPLRKDYNPENQDALGERPGF